MIPFQGGCGSLIPGGSPAASHKAIRLSGVVGEGLLRPLPISPPGAAAVTRKGQFIGSVRICGTTARDPAMITHGMKSV